MSVTRHRDLTEPAADAAIDPAAIPAPASHTC